MTSAHTPSDSSASGGADAAALAEQIVALVGSQAERRGLSLPEALHLALHLHQFTLGRLPARPVPAVAVEDSIQADFLICLETGKSFKMLRRHLQEDLGMTPEEYRRKWHLPTDYPMTAPSYAAAKARAARASSPDRYGRRRQRGYEE